MMAKMMIEDLDKVLVHKNIEILTDHVNKGGYLNRLRTFAVDGIMYQIKWYINQSTLFLPGGCAAMFTEVEQSHTWPSGAKMNLQFRYNDDVVFVLPIEQYETEGER